MDKSFDLMQSVLASSAIGALAYWAGFLGTKYKDPKQEERKSILSTLDHMARDRDHYRRMMRAHAHVRLSPAHSLLFREMEANIAVFDYLIRENERDATILETRLATLDAEIKKEADELAAKRKAEDEKRAKADTEPASEPKGDESDV